MGTIPFYHQVANIPREIGSDQVPLIDAVTARTCQRKSKPQLLAT